MANEKEPTPGTRGYRADQVRRDLGLDRQQFADLLAERAAALGLTSGGKWTQTRVSKLILGRQPISLDDAAVVIDVDPEHRGWDWFVFGDARVGKIKPRPAKASSEGRRSG